MCSREAESVSLLKLQDDLARAVRQASPIGRKQYRNVTAIFFRWEVEDILFEPYEAKLKRVFSNLYRFTVVSYPIRSSYLATPESLESYVIQAIRNHLDPANGENDLTIIVYSGHVTGGATECLWINFRGRLKSPPLEYVNWDRVRFVADDAPGDVLVILDCCYTTARTGIDSHVELLAACGRDCTTEARYSLTKALAEVLEATLGRRTTIAQIQAALIHNSRSKQLGAVPVYAEWGHKLNGSIELYRNGEIGVAYASRRLTPAPGLESDSDVRFLVSATVQKLPEIQLFKAWWNQALNSSLPVWVSDTSIRFDAEASWLVRPDCLLLDFSMPMEVFLCLRALGPYTLRRRILAGNQFLLQDFPQDQVSPPPWRGHLYRGHQPQGSVRAGDRTSETEARNEGDSGVDRKKEIGKRGPVYVAHPLGYESS
ncbi:hypothetical protein EDC01DRAFT_405504 [Geopyxis carbonaria]|nr:hypothetical protein EDC01DRAFT_405504 [Geopyxis carbonaria]